MKKTRTSFPRKGRRFSLEEAAAISAVEGLSVTREMRAAFAAMEKSSLSPAQRRATLISKFGKGSPRRG